MVYCRSVSLLKIENLSIEFVVDEQKIQATDRVHLELNSGQILGLVGESGCGKSVTSLAILKLLSGNGRISQGKIFFKGQDLVAMSEDEIRRVRGKKIAMIFQEPMTALNPVYSVGRQLSETLRLHFPKLPHTEIHSRAVELFKSVGIDSPESRLKQYPHELSGGMRQRALIAIALSGEPELLIADEPTTALDVTIQAQILELLKSIVKKRSMSLILISHDFGVISEMCDRVAVMYAGQVVEEGAIPQFFASAKHPYSRGLIESLNQLDQGDRVHRLRAIRGLVRSPMDRTPGCRFLTRCDFSQVQCSEKAPEMKNSVACFYPVEGPL